MNSKITRLTAVTGTTMALVIAGTAAVSAAGPRDGDDFGGFGDRQMAGKAGMGGMHGGMGIGRGMRMGGGLRGLADDLERAERTIQTADGTTTARIEQGVVESAGDASLSFTLGSGEVVSVVIDEETNVVALEEQEVMNARGWTRTRMAPTPVEAADIESGAEIVVWSDAEDDAEFVASRVVIRPAEADEAVEATEETETAEETTEDAAATDA